MYAKLYSSSVLGVDGCLVEVEVDLANGLPSFDIIGLGDTAISEARDRVRSAIKNSGFVFPLKRITTNLAPADIRKVGSSFDLAIAAGILTASGQLGSGKGRRIGLTWEAFRETLFLGELSLEGKLRPVQGILPMVISALQRGFKRVILPQENGEEASLTGISIIPIADLHEVARYMVGDTKPEYILLHSPAKQIMSGAVATAKCGEQETDFSDVYGQCQVKRALEVAAAGIHNVLMMGAPGAGKTMLARRMAGIMPEMTFEESLEVTKIHSAAGKLTHITELIRCRPFRSPHHTITRAGMAGGGARMKPGEVSLAHRGILFLDEMPEFPRDVLEVLRQPMEDGTVMISRARSAVTFPAQFMLVAAMNPCPCGYQGAEVGERECNCSPTQVKRYRSRLSGPLLDRMDMLLEVPRVDKSMMDGQEESESSAEIHKRVNVVREVQRERWSDWVRHSDFHASMRHDGFDLPNATTFNSRMTTAMIRRYCVLTGEAKNLLRAAYERLGFSARAHQRILKVSRTISDLDGREEIDVQHVAEALQYRGMVRSGQAL